MLLSQEPPESRRGSQNPNSQTVHTPLALSLISTHLFVACDIGAERGDRKGEEGGERDVSGCRVGGNAMGCFEYWRRANKSVDSDM